MAKYRHRNFEMYEFREEAIQALMSSFENPEPDAATPDLSAFKYLTVSCSAGLTLVEFKDVQTFDEETVRGLREDFTRLADRLQKDSKVLLDFTGVESFSPNSIEALVMFNKHLKNKGSRIVLCSLGPKARQCFFVTRSP